MYLVDDDERRVIDGDVRDNCKSDDAFSRGLIFLDKRITVSVAV